MVIESCCQQSRIASLESALTERDAEIAEHNDFMAFMAGELSKFECCCENGNHKSTPPMMWPELIRCIVRKAVEKSKQPLAPATAPEGEGR